MAKKKHRKVRGRSATHLFGGRRIRRRDYVRRKNMEGKPETEEREEDASAESSNREDLLEELGILNLSIELVTIVVIATALNLYYVHSLKAQTLDELYDTNLKDSFIDTSNFPRITNTLFLFTTGIFLILNYSLFEESKRENLDNSNDKEVISSYKSFIATLFTFIAVMISRDNLDM